MNARCRLLGPRVQALLRGAAGQVEVRERAGPGYAIHGFVPATTPAPGGPGEWRTFDITLVGRNVTMAVNGVTTVDNQEIPGITGGALDSNEAEPGPILLQGDHPPWSSTVTSRFPCPSAEVAGPRPGRESAGCTSPVCRLLGRTGGTSTPLIAGSSKLFIR